MTVTQADRNWEEFHRTRVAQNYPRWPNELMLKLVHGSYLARRLEISAGSRVLDVGCGFGNNLLPFLEMGCECHGTEVTEETAAIADRVIRERGHRAEFRHGYNQHLPYDDGSFDLLLSINVLHYEKTEEDIEASLAEYARVLSPQGALLLITVGPEHTIYRRARVLAPHRYVVQDFDFRDGEQYFYFDSDKYLAHYLGRHFGDVETGRATEKLMTKPLDFLLAVARGKTEASAR